jgi:hypothetical protein
MWEGSPPLSFVTLSCSLCCLGHREEGRWNRKTSTDVRRVEAKGDQERQKPMDSRVDLRGPGSWDT